MGTLNQRTERIWLKFFSSTYPQSVVPMENLQQEFQPSFTLGTTGSMLPESMYQRDTLQISHGNHQRMESQQAVQTPGGKCSQDKGESCHYPS
ncbi:hypothetical protein O181_097700 [Austropuccinia psidii MF-1]|uniref:Uncharacterized protein n=1 Tax=Austropuccinia psidii MF-1 TaxID=1389203 RepID=A0A9Q3J7X1_9BASI|nr:hypothetical protein [Austropuccinia psidii MF-1]